MTASKIIKYIIKKSRKTNQTELAELMGINKRALESKFYRDNFEANDLFKIADVLGLKIVFINEEEQVIFDTSNIKNIEA